MSTANAKVAIELYVDDQGTLRVKQFSADTQDAFRKSEQAGVGAAGRIKSAWVSLQAATAGIIAAIMAVAGAWNLANNSAKAEQEKRSFASLAASYGTNGNKIITELKRISKGTIDTMTLVRNAGTAMMMGINPEDVVGLMEIARATAKMTGQTTVKAFEDITLAVGRQSKMILDNLGIILDVEKANQEYAKSLGKTSTQLTDVERKQAFMQATMKAGRELMGKLGNQTDTASDKLERLTATFENIKVTVGSGVLKVFYFLEGTFTSVAAGALALSGGIFKVIESVTSLTDKLHITKNAAAEWEINTKAAFAAADDLARKADQSFKDMVSSNEQVLEGGAAYQKQLRETTQLLDEQNKKKKAIVDEEKKAAQEQADAEREMYEEAGFGAEKYFDKQASELVKKAARWEKAGADQYEVEQWLYNKIGELSAEAYAKEEYAAGQAMDSLQAMSRTLIEQYDEANLQITEQLDAVGIKIDELDGRNIGLTTTFDGGVVTTGIDELIGKLQQLKAVSASAASSNASSAETSQGSNTTVNESTTSTANTSNTTIVVNEPSPRNSAVNMAQEFKRQEERG